MKIDLVLGVVRSNYRAKCSCGFGAAEERMGLGLVRELQSGSASLDSGSLKDSNT